MLIREALGQFYKQHNIPDEGGVEMSSFTVPLGWFSLRLPNPQWRRDKLHIHDIEHILNAQDTSWRGEVFIASWEIATGFWRYFPVCIFPLWAIGLGWWILPASVVRGFRRGLTDTGIAAQKLTKTQLYALTVDELRLRVLQTRNSPGFFGFYLRLTVLFLVSEFIFLSPLWVPAAAVVGSIYL